MSTIDQAYAANGSPQHWYWAKAQRKAVWCTEATWKEAEPALEGPYDTAEDAIRANMPGLLDDVIGFSIG